LKRPADGAREKKIVDQLRAEERQRHTKQQLISPHVPPQ
jgi:hypothetical protein